MDFWEPFFELAIAIQVLQLLGPAMARASALSKALVAAGALMALRLLSGEAFVTPKQRNEAAAALAAAMVAASSAPAMAEVPTFSVFGFGSGQSDAYSQNDNPINPYSQFSEVGADTVYKARNVDEVARKTKALQAALKRFETTPEYIATKQAQNLKANLLEAGGSLKEDMYYFSGEEGSKAFEKGPSVCSEGWHPGRWWPEQAVGPRSWGLHCSHQDSCWVEGSLQLQVDIVEQVLSSFRSWWQVPTREETKWNQARVRGFLWHAQHTITYTVFQYCLFQGLSHHRIAVGFEEGDLMSTRMFVAHHCHHAALPAWARAGPQQQSMHVLYCFVLSGTWVSWALSERVFGVVLNSFTELSVYHI